MRSISEIYDILIQEKNTMSELDAWVTAEQGEIENADLLLKHINSGSGVATWTLWLWLVAFGSWLVEQLFGVHKTEITGILATKAPHTLRWYAVESKLFQYGYTMIWDGNFYKYDPVVPEAQIVKYAAASEQGNKVILKVAKGTDANKTYLSPLEKAQFIEFWSRWKDAGVTLEVISLSPDLLKVDITIIRDRLVLDAQNRLLRDTSIYPIEEAINTFSNNLDFDGILRLSKLVDAIQSAEGVVDVKLNNAWHKPASGQDYVLVNMSVVPDSGYFQIDVENSVIVYIDSVNVDVQSE